MIISVLRTTVSLFFFIVSIWLKTYYYPCFESYTFIVLLLLFLFDWPLMIISLLRAIVSLLLNSFSYLIDHLWLSMFWKSQYHCSFLIVPIWLISYDFPYWEPQFHCSFYTVPIWLTTYYYLCFESHSTIVPFSLFRFDWTLMINFVLRTTVSLFFFIVSILLLIISWLRTTVYCSFF